MKARNVLAASVAAALSIGAVKSAEAAYAYAYQNVTDFTLSDPSNVINLFASTTDVTFAVSTGASRHDLPAASDGGELDADESFAGTGVSAPGNNNCSGGSCIGKNGDYGYGDAEITDSDITAGGSAWNIAEAYAPGEGGEFEHFGNSDNSLTLDFVAANSGALTFDWDFYVELITNTLPDSADGTQAIARVNFFIDITDVTNGGVFDEYSPDDQNKQRVSNKLVLNNNYVESGSDTFTTLSFVQGNQYQISVTMEETAQASQVVEKVPVPATLGLLGLGLVGFGATRRVRQS